MGPYAAGLFSPKHSFEHLSYEPVPCRKRATSWLITRRDVIIYVETNFVMELALFQEEHAQCRGLLDLAAGTTSAQLALPAFSIGEAYEAFERKRRNRRRLHRELLEEMGQLGRSQDYAERAAELREATAFLVRSGEEQKRRLDATLEEVLEAARILPLEAETFQTAVGYQRTLGLGPQDALVFASALVDLQQRRADEPSCLLTKNTDDFADDDVVAELDRFGCKPLFTYQTGLNYARGLLGQ